MKKSPVRCEWGRSAVQLLSPESDVVIVVDVLSFSTCVDIAISRGARVFPFDPSVTDAGGFAELRDATLALPRGEGRYSLSPATFLDIESGASVVLPSPNGAMSALAVTGGAVLAGCLRNAEAVAAAVSCLGPSILVVPAGERWPDGSLRPCLEDWLGAGAILSHLAGPFSAEARAAMAAWRELKPELPEVLRACLSGRELIDRGYPQDVELAAEFGVSGAAPVFDGNAFHDQTERPRSDE